MTQYEIPTWKEYRIALVFMVALLFWALLSFYYLLVAPNPEAFQQISILGGVSAIYYKAQAIRAQNKIVNIAEQVLKELAGTETAFPSADHEHAKWLSKLKEEVQEWSNLRSRVNKTFSSLIAFVDIELTTFIILQGGLGNYVVCVLHGKGWSPCSL